MDLKRHHGYGRATVQMIQALLFPEICPVCRRPFVKASRLLPVCRHCLPRLPYRFGKRRLAWPCQTGLLSGRAEGVTALRPLWAQCTDLVVPFYYRAPIAPLILQLKFADRPELAEPLGCLLAGVIKDQAPVWDAVCAVPLHRSRLRERGYNQSALLAEVVARELGLPDWSSCLIRLRKTARQSEMESIKARRNNVQGAFSWTGPRPDWSGVHLLLVDDVWTTGATMTAAASELLRQGLRQLTGLVLASDHEPAAGAATSAKWPVLPIWPADSNPGCPRS